MVHEICRKMIDEALAAQHADVDTVKQKRGTEFRIDDAKAYVEASRGMRAAGDQSKAVFQLHRDSIETHFATLSALTDAVRPEDDPFVEHYQTPVVLALLIDQDPAFAKSLEIFVEQIGKSEALIGRESIRRYGGLYGPTCVVDFALIPGSTSNVVNRILKDTPIPTQHKQAILAAKSWGMNTSYGIGEVFANALEAGKTAAEASAAEVAQFQAIYRDPVGAQADLMDAAGQSSFDHREYMARYRTGIESAVKAALDEEVHYANIVTIPAYCVGDIAHHISQSTYNMCKDDVVMAAIEAATAVMETTLMASLDRFTDVYQPLALATGSTAAASEYLLELDGFNAPMVVDLLTRRYHNFVQLKPNRSAAAELHNCDFMDMVYRGWKLIDKARRMQNGAGGVIVPKVAGFPVDLAPIHENEVLMNPQRYTYPACAITVRFSAMMRLADYPCLLTSEPVTATMMTNIIALEPKKPAAPVRSCKGCAAASLVELHHQYCQWREAV